MATIYCVEDDDGIRELITCALKTGGYEVSSFAEAKSFEEGLRRKIPSLILLDIMLPGKDGLKILSELKAGMYADIPVIMLTARSTELDKVNGLEAGADDYITKPFGIMELLSRVKAVLRRAGGTGSAAAEQYIVANLVLDAPKHKVTVGEKDVELTYKEFELLKYLVQHPGRVFTRAQLLQEVWGYDYYGGTRTVDVHVRRLRAKLGGEYEHLIGTVRNVGYRFDPPEEESANNTAREAAEMGSPTSADE